MECPCKKDCPERSANCHVLCERWKQYEAQKREIYKKADNERPAKFYLSKSMKRNNHDFNIKKTSTLRKGGMVPMTNSKAKGARFERLLASKFREYGYKDARRSVQYCGNTGEAADVVNLPGIHVEAKHQEKMYLYDWMAQAVRDAEAGGGGKLPAVFHKKNNADILVTMRLEDWFNLYREWEAGQNSVVVIQEGIKIPEDWQQRIMHTFLGGYAERTVEKNE